MLAKGLACKGLAIAERAYQQALDYAKERKQGMKADRSGKAFIIEHPDVLRMLMTMKSQIDAMRSLVYVAAIENDLSHLADGEVKAKAVARTALYTPIVKGWITEQAQEITSLAIQVHGGMGFIEETGVAQHARDARILPIYEGTNGIQAIDLIGRKLYADKGAAMQDLLAEMTADLEQWKDSDIDAPLVKLGQALEQAQQATEYCLAAMQKDSTLGTGSAYAYMMLMGYVIGSWLQIKALVASQQDTQMDVKQKQSWRQSVIFYCDHILPRANAFYQAIESGRDSVEVLSEESFAR